MDVLRSIWRYYMYLAKRLFLECWHSWKKEVQGNVAISVITYCLTVQERGAGSAFKIALFANLIWLCIFIGWHLIRTPWLVQREGLPGDVLRHSKNLTAL